MTEITHAGMDALTEIACMLIHSTRGCKSKDEVVQELYKFYQNAKKNLESTQDPKNKAKMIKLCQKFFVEDIQKSEERYEKALKNSAENQAFVENFLLIAAYTEKKLSWREILYTHTHGVLPLERRKQRFPVEELKKELGKGLKQNEGRSM